MPKTKTSSPRTTTKRTKPLDNPAWNLGPNYLLPDFNTLGGTPQTGRVAMGWSESGLFLEAVVVGKNRPIRYVQDRGGFSDGLRIWIDTRNSPHVHRATRFCHCFHFFPGSLGDRQSNAEDLPRGILDEVARAKEHPASIRNEDLQVRSTAMEAGYQLNAFIPATCLTGYLPTEFDRIRLFYDLVDAELGTQSQSLSAELRYAEDPSLWIEARLVRD